jgi:N-acetylneuraminic acid mutarotase
MPQFRNSAFAISIMCLVGWSFAGPAGLAQNSHGGRLPGGEGWRAEANMSDPVIFASAAEINGIIYVAGGLDSGGRASTLQAYNPATNKWATLAPLPETLYQSDGAGVINSQLYIVGGWNGSLPTDKLYVYDPPSNKWAQKASMSHLSACGVTGVINAMLYVTTACNGYSKPPYDKDLDVYDPATDTWTSLANSMAAHSQPAGAVINGLLYVAGGLNGKSVVTSVTEVYNPATNTWTKLASMPVAVVEPASVELDGKLWVFGGYTGTDFESIVQVYDPVKNKWEKSTFALPAATSAGAAAVVDGVAFFAGGGNTNNIVGNTYGLFVLPSIP